MLETLRNSIQIGLGGFLGDLWVHHVVLRVTSQELAVLPNDVMEEKAGTSLEFSGVEIASMTFAIHH